MLDTLEAEGLTDLSFMVVTASGPGWDSHAAGYEQVTFPIMPDTADVIPLYGADPYDVFLIDRQGRLVTSIADFSEALIAPITQRLRELHAE